MLCKHSSLQSVSCQAAARGTETAAATNVLTKPNVPLLRSGRVAARTCCACNSLRPRGFVARPSCRAPVWAAARKAMWPASRRKPSTQFGGANRRKRSSRSGGTSDSQATRVCVSLHTYRLRCVCRFFRRAICSLDFRRRRQRIVSRTRRFSASHQFPRHTIAIRWHPKTSASRAPLCCGPKRSGRQVRRAQSQIDWPLRTSGDAPACDKHAPPLAAHLQFARRRQSAKVCNKTA